MKCSFDDCDAPATTTVSAQRHGRDWMPPWLPYLVRCGDAVYEGTKPPHGSKVAWRPPVTSRVDLPPAK